MEDQTDETRQATVIFGVTAAQYNSWNTEYGLLLQKLKEKTPSFDASIVGETILKAFRNDGSYLDNSNEELRPLANRIHALVRKALLEGAKKREYDLTKQFKAATIGRFSKISSQKQSYKLNDQDVLDANTMKRIFSSTVQKALTTGTITIGDVNKFYLIRKGSEIARFALKKNPDGVGKHIELIFK